MAKNNADKASRHNKALGHRRGWTQTTQHRHKLHNTERSWNCPAVSPDGPKIPAARWARKQWHQRKGSSMATARDSETTPYKKLVPKLLRGCSRSSVGLEKEAMTAKRLLRTQRQAPQAKRSAMTSRLKAQSLQIHGYGTALPSKGSGDAEEKPSPFTSKGPIPLQPSPLS